MVASPNGDGAGASEPPGADARLLGRAQDRVETTVGGKYRLDRLLGVGGMAAVYAAVHLRNGSRVAVKILHRELSNDEAIRARFLREGYLANSVSHPAAVHVLDDCVADDGSPFLVMELVEGETLDRRWSRSGGKLDVGEVLRLLDELLDVLAAAHEKGIVHRDIKPENVSVTTAGRIKLLDFGIARDDSSSPGKTMIGTVLGSPAFMSPEQALGRTDDVDALSDIWSVGATAFALLSGRPVHAAESANETLARAALMPAVPLSTVAPHVPASLAGVIDRALAFEKSSRWSSARSMHDALRASIGEGAHIASADAAEIRHAVGRVTEPAAQRTQVIAPVPRTVTSPSLAHSGLAPARTSWSPAVPVVITAAEEVKWRRDLRRRRSRPILIAVFGLGMTALAGTSTLGDLSSVWGRLAPHGLVTAATPASGSTKLADILPSGARLAPAASALSRANANATDGRWRDLVRSGGTPQRTPSVLQALSMPDARIVVPGAGSAATAASSVMGEADKRPEGDGADGPDGALRAVRSPPATWPDEAREVRDPSDSGAPNANEFPEPIGAAVSAPSASADRSTSQPP